jgi:hypothetical protein
MTNDVADSGVLQRGRKANDAQRKCLGALFKVHFVHFERRNPNLDVTHLFCARYVST